MRLLPSLRVIACCGLALHVPIIWSARDVHAQQSYAQVAADAEGDRNELRSMQPASSDLRLTRPQTRRPTATKQSPEQALEWLNEAFRLSQTGNSVEDFTKIIENCELARQVSLGDQEAKYARDLLAWAYNRRGELVSAEAAELANQGNVAESAQLDEQALADFNAAVQIDPHRWKALHNRGVNYGLLGHHEEALADFTRVLELKSDYANAWFNRAEVHLETGRYSAAVRDYSEALKLMPADAAAFYGRARSFALVKKYPDALEDFNQAIELEPTLPEYRVERGELHMRLGDWKNAAADFRRSIELDPEHARAYRSAAWLMATCPEAKYRNAKIALETAEKAVRLAEAEGKLDYTYLDVLAAASANAGRFSTAEDILRDAILESPPNVANSLKHRLAVYENQQPFRMRGKEAASLVRTASTPVKTTR
jgi:tetratricopeptide (TPR) repeat protein